MNKILVNVLRTLVFCVCVVMANTAVGQLPEPAPGQEELSGGADLSALKNAVVQQNFPEAIRIGEELVGQADAGVEVWKALGYAYAQQPDQFEKAEKAFVRVRELEPGDAENLKNLAILKSELGRADAPEFAAIAADADSQSAEMQIFAARLLANASKREDAQRYFSRALSAEPDNMVALTALGELYVTGGEYAKAIDLYTKAIQNDGVTNVIAYINLGVALMQAGRYEECIEWSDKGLLKYKDGGLAASKGKALIKLKRYAEAEAFLESFTKSGGRKEFGTDLALALAKALQGCNLAEHGSCAGSAQQAPCCLKDAEALALYEAQYQQTQNADRWREELDLRYGLALVSNNKLEDAEAVLQQALELAKLKALPTGPYFAALSVCMQLFAQKRDTDLALQYYREAVENAPDFSSPQRMSDFRQWPPLGVDVMKEIQASSSKSAQNKAKCGCHTHDVPRGPRYGEFVMLLVMVATLLVIRPSLRRKERQ